MHKYLLTFLIVIFLFFPNAANAQNLDEPVPHFTIILNQVRGPECCDRGNLAWFKQQQSQLESNDLTGNFAIRYDALNSESYTNLIKNDQRNQYGALLEITPQLTKDAGVTYKSDPARWYEAQNVYLIGYPQEERKKIIDTYMAGYKKQLGTLPKFSSAWMIDAWSLRYLKNEYGIVAHQITREQFGTDSYTLYGGPVHYPYYPSNNWALIPQTNNISMPLIIRQTISDPVFIYGDKTDSYTSQPNDYYIRDDTTAYFTHLFNQAHSQNNQYTFALIGLENTMPEGVQAEFGIQLREVGNWQKANDRNKTVTVSDFEAWRRQQSTLEITSYEGAAQKDSKEKAWWINTSKYRARIRLSAGELSITDLRLYDPGFKDPYLTDSAKSLGWWVVPFVLDGSRYFNDNVEGSTISNDSLKNRPAENGQPLRIILGKNITSAELVSTGENKTLQTNAGNKAVFTNNEIELTNDADMSLLDEQPAPLQQLVWSPNIGHLSWGFRVEGQTLIPFVNTTNLDQARTEYNSFLFPEKQFEKINIEKSYLYINNDRSIAGRNPVRLVLFPKNDSGEAILLPSYPQVNAKPSVDDISIHEQHQNNGMVFIDLTNKKALKTTVKIKYEEFEKELTIYFAPNCKEQKIYCLLHPRQSWWYVQTYLDDKKRAKEELDQKENSFVDQQ